MTHITKDEALKLALEALEMFCEHGAILDPIKIKDAIKQVIENSKKKPLVYLSAQPKPLTWERVNDLWLLACNDQTRLPTYVVFARAIETDHGVLVDYALEGNN